MAKNSVKQADTIIKYIQELFASYGLLFMDSQGLIYRKSVSPHTPRDAWPEPSCVMVTIFVAMVRPAILWRRSIVRQSGVGDDIDLWLVSGFYNLQPRDSICRDIQSRRRLHLHSETPRAAGSLNYCGSLGEHDPAIVKVCAASASENPDCNSSSSSMSGSEEADCCKKENATYRDHNKDERMMSVRPEQLLRFDAFITTPPSCFEPSDAGTGGAAVAWQPCCHIPLHPFVDALRDLGQWLCAPPFRTVCPLQDVHIIGCYLNKLKSSSNSASPEPPAYLARLNPHECSF